MIKLDTYTFVPMRLFNFELNLKQYFRLEEVDVWFDVFLFLYRSKIMVVCVFMLKLTVFSQMHFQYQIT